MTFRQANTFIRRWRPVICPEWTVTLVNAPSPRLEPEQHAAAVEPVGGGAYLRARIYLHKVTSGELDREACERTLLHELLHLALNDLELAAREAAKGLSYDACKLAEETIDRYVERSRPYDQAAERAAQRISGPSPSVISRNGVVPLAEQARRVA